MKPNAFSDLSIGVATDPGRKRRDEPNQDSVLAVPAEKGHPPLLIVADGMGGHAGGADASRLVTEAIAYRYRQAGKVDDLPALLRDCLQAAYNALAGHVTGHPELASMGSTAVLAVPNAGQVLIANVGDSRAYRLRYANPPDLPRSRKSLLATWFRRAKQPVKEQERAIEIHQLSYDHSVVADLVRAGQLTPLQALQSPQRNRLTQSITPRRPELTPFINTFPFGADDTLLLCTDGLWGVVPEATLAAIALEIPPKEAVDKLVHQALSYGGPDNISVIIARQDGRR
jgi:serine/threonine protein phosphatase PrpC